MAQDLSFKQLCKMIKTDCKEDPKVLELVDKLLGLTFICSPVILGPGAALLLPLIGTKNELVNIGKWVFKTFTAKKDDDYVARHDRMRVAHGLLVFTAFFDALDTLLPEALREKFRLHTSEKAFLAKEAAGKAPGKSADVAEQSEPDDAFLAAVELVFPHPTETLADLMERQTKVWGQMARGFGGFIQKLAVWEEAGDKERADMVSWIAALPNAAAGFYEAQYCELARRFEDFAVWANLQEHKKTKAVIGELSEYVKQHALLTKSSDKTIDIGFTRLHQAVLNIPRALEVTQAGELVQSLSKHYRARINDPIIEDKDEPAEGKPRLSFPKVQDAFIPQSFRVLRQVGKGRSLEDEGTWQDLPRRNDLGAFMLSYLSSPYSAESPLLVLGHPGSGKSLLTTVLSSQLMSEQYTAIRVPLREVNAEAGIVTQIEEAIRRITNVSVDSWAKLSATFKNNPPLVILDGYDELLQASGKVFAGYLKDVQHFQKSEAEQGRPVRAIVTSRVTLIDKATVPAGATIVRLLEFDGNQRERWIRVWNRANQNYFAEAHIEEFGLPEEKEAGSEKVLALAEQPLLLLMLALYDSQDNQLRKSKGLDRTKLYDSLLRRFVARERGKDRGFEDGMASDRKRVLDMEMQRLGVAALGMYNRRKVHTLTSELNDDLRFFSLERTLTVATGRPLSQAELLLGSFFFIHKSKMQPAATDVSEETSAFEFLHNTFGEFLTADFILRRALAEVEALEAFQSNEALKQDLEKRLNSADGFKREWFASLVYTPLFTRPVILEMMREWIGSLLAERGLSRAAFLAAVDTIVLNQIARLLNKREMPSIVRKETAQEGYRAPFGDHPLLGHIAIYSINLILFRVIACDEPFVFDEKQIATHEDGARPWDRLAHIWRSWFSLDNLNGLTAVIVAEREESRVTIVAKKKLQVADSHNRLETCLNVAVSLGDNISSGLTGLLLFSPARDNALGIDDVLRRLAGEKIDPGFHAALDKLLWLEGRIHTDGFADFAQTARAAIELALQSERYIEIEHAVLSIRRVLKRFSIGADAVDTFRQVVDPRVAVQLSLRSPGAALLLCQTAAEVLDHEWSYRFQREFLENALKAGVLREAFDRHPESITTWSELLLQFDGHVLDRALHSDALAPFLDGQTLSELAEERPELALGWLRLVLELGGGPRFERIADEYVERVLAGLGDGYLARVLERSPKIALAWLELALQHETRVDSRLIRKALPQRAIEETLDPRRLMNLAEKAPRVALRWLELTEKISERVSRRLLDDESFGVAFLERTFDWRQMTRDSEFALMWTGLYRRIGGHMKVGDGREFRPRAFDRQFHPRRLSEIRGMDPEAALVLLEAFSGLAEGGGNRAEREYVERSIASVARDPRLRQKPAVFARALRIARHLESARVTDALGEFLTSLESGSQRLTSFVGGLPLASLPDVLWLGTTIQAPDLERAIRSLISTLDRSS